MSYEYQYMIGTSVASMQFTQALGVRWPRHDFSPYSTVWELGDGSKRGVGSPSATWHWDFIPRVQWEVLKAFSTGVSTPIYIRTKDDMDEWRTYFGIMIWPANSEWVVTRGLRFTLEFRALVEMYGILGVGGIASAEAFGTPTISLV